MEEIASPGKEEVGPTSPLISISVGQSASELWACASHPAESACLPRWHGPWGLSQPGRGCPWPAEVEPRSWGMVGGNWKEGPRSSPRPNKQKLRRQPLEEMHVDIFINPVVGDRSPGTSSEGTAGPSDNSSSHSRASHAQGSSRRPAPYPPYPSATPIPLHPQLFPGEPQPWLHVLGPRRASLCSLAQSRLGHGHEQKVQRLDQGLANGVPRVFWKRRTQVHHPRHLKPEQFCFIPSYVRFPWKFLIAKCSVAHRVEQWLGGPVSVLPGGTENPTGGGQG